MRSFIAFSIFLVLANNYVDCGSTRVDEINALIESGLLLDEGHNEGPIIPDFTEGELLGRQLQAVPSPLIGSGLSGLFDDQNNQGNTIPDFTGGEWLGYAPEPVQRQLQRDE
eukprot:Filipodium_phascolosomae@DN69_c0_g1_i1.p1